MKFFANYITLKTILLNPIDVLFIRKFCTKVMNFYK